MSVSFNDLSQQAKAITVGTLLVLVAIIVASLTLLPRAVNHWHQQQVSDETAQLGRDYAKALDQHLQRLQDELDRELRRNRAAEALVNGSVQVVVDFIQPQLPQLLSLKLVALDGDWMREGLRFSQIERLNDQATKPLQPEAFQLGEQYSFDVLRPITDSADQVVGYAIAIFSIDALGKPLANSSGNKLADVQLEQQFATGRSQTVYHSAKQPGSKPATRQPTVVPHWKVGVVPGAALAMSSVSRYSILALQIASILGSLLVLYLIVKKLQPTYTAMPTAAPKKVAVKAAGTAAALEPALTSAIASGDNQNELEELDLSLDELDELDLEIRPAASTPAAESLALAIPAHIFRDYDIRGNAEQDLTDAFARQLGQAFASECLSRGENSIVLAGDGRLSTPRLKEQVKQGLLAAGCRVIDIGEVPTPVMYFATNTLPGTRSGIMVTASHNPPEDNGFKMVIGGDTLTGEQIQQIKRRMVQDDLNSGLGEACEDNLLNRYIDHIVNDIVLAGSYRVVVDAACGIAGNIAPRLLEELGCDVIPLHCEVDGNFPAHEPDPSNPANLGDLIAKVQEEDADLGIALDGDGDRLSVVTASGQVVLPDRILMLFAKDIVSRNPGVDVVYDVKCTRALSALIANHGGRPVMWKSGHSQIKQKMKESNALLGGELSGHIFFKERWFGFDDGLYAAARLLEIMSIRAESLDDILTGFPSSISTPEIRVPCAEEEKFTLIDKLSNRGQWGNGRITDIDGLRIDFTRGWGLVRASNTQPALTFRFEADDSATLEAVQQVFKQQLAAVAPSLILPF